MLVMLLALLGIAPVQPAAGLPGTWVAEHRGTTFIRLELKGAGGTLSGMIGIGNVRFDDKSEVIEVGPLPATLTPLIDVALNGSSLSFAMKEGNDADHFQLKMVGVDQAELTFSLSEDVIEELKDEGLPMPGPIRLHKIR